MLRLLRDTAQLLSFMGRSGSEGGGRRGSVGPLNIRRPRDPSVSPPCVSTPPLLFPSSLKIRGPRPLTGECTPVYSRAHTLREIKSRRGRRARKLFEEPSRTKFAPCKLSSLASSLSPFEFGVYRKVYFSPFEALSLSLSFSCRNQYFYYLYLEY